jgi:PPP family 3-phenylpropionic acid transporter
MSASKIHPNVLFSALQIFFWSAFCLTSTYMALYLESKGYAKDQIGQLMAISALTLMLGQYFWGTYCYKYKWLSHKHILLFCFCVAIGCNMMVPLFSSQYWVIVVLFSLITFTLSSMSSMIDAWTMFRKLDMPSIHYGLSRGMGSVAFSIVVIGFGYVFRVVHIESMFLFSSFFIFLGICISIWIHRGREENSVLISKIAGITAIRQFLVNQRFMVFMISMCLIFIAYNANSTFFGPLITFLGGSSREFGQGIFISAIGQLPIMLLSAWLLKKIPAYVLLAISFICLIMTTIILFQASSIFMAITAQVFVSIGFGIYIAVSVVYLTQILHQSEVTLGIMLMNSVSYGLSGILGNMLGGLISQQFGLFRMFEINAYVMMLGFLIFVGSFFFLKPLSKH